MQQLHIDPLDSSIRPRPQGQRRPRAFRTALLACLLCALPALAAEDAEGAETFEQVIKAGETMMVKVPLDTGSIVNGYYSVDTLGYVNLPVMGTVFVNNLSTRQIESMISQKMSAYMRDTHVSVSPVVRLALLGSWQKPGMYYVNPEVSVWEACMVAGSPVFEKKIDRWKVMRGTVELPIALADEFSHGTSLRKAGIRSGDIFVIPIPDPNSGFWYWFKESLSATAQVATILTTAMTAYITITLLDRGTITR